MEIMGILNPIKICPEKNVASVPQVYFLYICSHHFFGAVTFEHLISVTELKYKLGFIIYHVEDMMRYLRNCHVRTPCRVRTPQFVQTTKLPIMMVI